MFWGKRDARVGRLQCGHAEGCNAAQKHEGTHKHTHTDRHIHTHRSWHARLHRGGEMHIIGCACTLRGGGRGAEGGKKRKEGSREGEGGRKEGRKEGLLQAAAWISSVQEPSASPCSLSSDWHPRGRRDPDRLCLAAVFLPPPLLTHRSPRACALPGWKRGGRSLPRLPSLGRTLSLLLPFSSIGGEEVPGPAAGLPLPARGSSAGRAQPGGELPRSAPPAPPLPGSGGSSK